MSEHRWLVRVGGGEPLGPLEEEKILRGLTAGKVPLEAEVQREGSAVWHPLRTTPPFATTVGLLTSQGRPSSSGSIAEETGALPVFAAPRPAPVPARWWLWACAAFFAVVAGVAGLLCKVQPTRTAEGTLQEIFRLLSAGDVVALRARKDLGQARHIQAEIMRLGGEELERRREILGRAEARGIAQYKDLEQRTRKAGEEEFRRLSLEEQRKIREESQLQFLLEHGFSSTTSEEQKALVSPEEMLDLGKRTALFRRLGERSFGDQEQQQLRQGDATDPAVQRLQSRALTLGEQEFARLWRRIVHQGQEAFDALPAVQQVRIRQKSLIAYLHAHGWKVLKKEEANLLGSEQAFLEDEEGLKKQVRKLVLATLTPQERAEVESIPDGKKKEAIDAFIEEHGARLVREALSKDMSAGGFSVAGLAYRGRSAHSLLRSASARVQIEFEEDREVPARKWLSPRLFFEYQRGLFTVPMNGNNAESTPDQLKILEGWLLQEKTDPALQQAGQEFLAALGRRLSGGLVGADLLVLGLLGATLWLLVKNRPEGLLTVEEGLVALVTLLLGAVQHLAQGQINADDWLVTPLYLALPGLVGAFRGPRSGYVAGIVAGGALLLGATLFRLAPETRTLLDQLPLTEFALFSIFLGLSGVLSGLASRQPVAAALPPLLWILGSTLLQRDLLWSPALYGRCALAVALSALLIAIRGAMTLTPPRPLLER